MLFQNEGDLGEITTVLLFSTNEDLYVRGAAWTLRKKEIDQQQALGTPQTFESLIPRGNSPS